MYLKFVNGESPCMSRFAKSFKLLYVRSNRFTSQVVQFIKGLKTQEININKRNKNYDFKKKNSNRAVVVERSNALVL